MTVKHAAIDGECFLHESEGGFCAAEISIDGVPLDRLIYSLRYGDLPSGDRGGCVDAGKEYIGTVRIDITLTADEEQER